MISTEEMSSPPCEPQVKALLGTKTYACILKAVDEGNVTANQAWDIANKLCKTDRRAVGDFKRAWERQNFTFNRWECRLLFSNVYQYSPADLTKESLVAALSDLDVALDALAADIEKIPPENNTTEIAEESNDITEEPLPTQRLLETSSPRSAPMGAPAAPRVTDDSEVGTLKPSATQVSIGADSGVEEGPGSTGDPEEGQHPVIPQKSDNTLKLLLVLVIGSFFALAAAVVVLQKTASSTNVSDTPPLPLLTTLRIGGKKTTSAQVLEMFSLSSCSSPIQPVPDLPRPLKAHFAAATPGGILVGGGKADVDDYDARTCYFKGSNSSTWTSLPPLNTPRKFACISARGSKVIVRGGERYDPHQRCHMSSEELDMEDMERGWQLTGHNETTCEGFICLDDVVVEVPC